jgi:hypothetical protein
MKLQMVQDAVVLKNNYLQGKAFYDSVNEHSKHRGGLVGYYRDMVTNEVNQLIDFEKMNLENEANNVTGSNLVNDLEVQAAAAAAAVTGGAMNAGIGALDSGVNAANGAYGGSKLSGYNSALRANATRAVSFQRNLVIASSAGTQITDSNTNVAQLITALKDLKQQANGGNIDDKAYEGLQLSMSAVQAQLSTEIHRMLAVNAQMTRAMLDSQNIEQAFSRQTAADMRSFYSRSARQREASGSDSAAVRTELNRMPR